MDSAPSDGDNGVAQSALAVAERWVAALNAHDVDRAVECFAVDYYDEAPARLGESVSGRDAVRHNFASLMDQLPDLSAQILRSIARDSTLWMEWRMQGTRENGSVMEFVGVNIFEVDYECFRRGWIYTELVREVGGIEAQVKRMTRGAE